ncbi:hypothetical protein HDU99_008899 [Rhizoclosmatium hyalinum]|nr:hypothetical protein HDU99_008899 [Rhizoclosmatium hyalinum]
MDLNSMMLSDSEDPPFREPTPPSTIPSRIPQFDLQTLLGNVNAAAAELPTAIQPSLVQTPAVVAAPTVVTPASPVKAAPPLVHINPPPPAVSRTPPLEDGQLHESKPPVFPTTLQSAQVQSRGSPAPQPTSRPSTAPTSKEDVAVLAPSLAKVISSNREESPIPTAASTPLLGNSSPSTMGLPPRPPAAPRRSSPGDLSSILPGSNGTPPFSHQQMNLDTNAGRPPQQPPAPGLDRNSNGDKNPVRSSSVHERGTQQQQQQQQQNPPSMNQGNGQKFPQRRMTGGPQGPLGPPQPNRGTDGFNRRPPPGPNATPVGGTKRTVEEAFPGLASGVRNMKSVLVNQMKFDAQKSGQLTTSAISKSSNSPDQATLESTTLSASNILISDKKEKPLLFSPALQPPEWSFKLILPVDLTLPSDKANDTTFSQLTTVSIIRRPGFPTFLLESEYTLKSLLPRSYFNILHGHGVPHNFVFTFTNPEHTLFKEMAGLRKTGYFNIKEAGSNEEWELHLKQSRERTNFFGYLIRASDLRNFIQQRMTMMTTSRKLPLVLDLDDTLVRMIGNEEGRYVPPHMAELVPNRVRALADGRKVVLTERVEEFLQWAQRYFEISVCSVGDQPYVDMVIAVLDPQRTAIRGAGYSARAEFMHIQGTSMARRPPKDLDSLMVFPTKGSGADANSPGGFSGPFVEALVIDDNVGMWPVDQQDNIIVVREQKNNKVWNVQLFPHVQNVLQSVHTEFYKQLDAWDSKTASPANPGPSSRQIYKEFLRNELTRKIAEPYIPVGSNNAVSVSLSETGVIPSPVIAQLQNSNIVPSPVISQKSLSPLIGTFSLPDD